MSNLFIFFLKKFIIIFFSLRFFGPEIKGDPNHNSLLDNHQQNRLELTKKDILQDWEKWTGVVFMVRWMMQGMMDDEQVKPAKMDRCIRDENNGWIQSRVCTCMLSHFSCVQLFETLWTVALQALLSMEIYQARILE